MVSGRKTTSLETELAEAKVVVAVEENGGGAHVVEAGTGHHGHDHHGGERKVGLLFRKADVAQAILRVMSVATSLTAVVFMVTAEEASTVSVYGFSLPVYSKWSFSDSFE